MPKRIEEDWKDFRGIIGGKVRKGLRKFIKSGQIFRLRPDGKGRIAYPIPQIDDPRIVHGKPSEGIGKGNVKPGDTIGKDNNGKGKGKGKGKPGDEPGEGMLVSLEMEDVIEFMADYLELPNLKPKTNETFEDTIIKYRKISLRGPESLRHNRRTMIQAIKRQAAEGTLDKLHFIPGSKDPVRLIQPINRDKRYRMIKEIKIPNSNALIIFARDGSGSMDDEKCGIISDMAWWLEAWISRFYEKTERVYVWHDTTAQEIDQDGFYKYRYGGGTKCSSAFEFISDQLKDRYPAHKWNVYLFYFTDGENWADDNPKLLDIIKNNLTPDKVNLTAITQILSYSYEDSVKQAVDEAVLDGTLNDNYVRTANIGVEKPGGLFGSMWTGSALSEEERGKQILRAIRTLLGGKDKPLSD